MWLMGIFTKVLFLKARTWHDVMCTLLYKVIMVSLWEMNHKRGRSEARGQLGKTKTPAMKNEAEKSG